MPESEAERLKRLREKQLTARDPLEHERKFQRNSAVKEKKAQKPIAIKEDWRRVPYSIKLPFFALIFGVIGTIILTKLLSWQYTSYSGAGITLVAMIFCVTLGNAIDLREDIKKHLK